MYSPSFDHARSYDEQISISDAPAGTGTVSPSSARSPRNESFLANLSGRGAQHNKVYVSSMRRNSNVRLDETILGAKMAQFVGELDDEESDKGVFFVVRWYHLIKQFLTFIYRLWGKQSWYTVFRHTIGILWAMIVAFYADKTGIDKLNGDYVALLGSLLGFLVAFRTNQGYVRYLEGRRMWGVVAFSAVGVMSQAISGLNAAPIANGKKLRTDIMNYMIGAAYGLKALLRDEALVAAELDGFISEKEVNEINTSFMWPSTYCLTQARKSMWHCGRDLNKIMEKSVMQFEEACSTCYVIHNNQFPVAYAFLLQVTVYIYMWGVPLYFHNQGLGWFLLPPSIVLNQLYAGLIDISVMLDDPFGTDLTDLNLDLFCHVLKQQVAQAVEVEEHWERMAELAKAGPPPQDDSVPAPASGGGGGGGSKRSSLMGNFSPTTTMVSAFSVDE